MNPISSQRLEGDVDAGVFPCVPGGLSVRSKTQGKSLDTRYVGGVVRDTVNWSSC